MQFLNPWLLVGMLAIAIPIAVHLFNFRRYRKLYFSNVHFLKELKQQTRKQSNLLHKLVLVSRILTYIFIVLAFAQPFIANKLEASNKEAKVVSVYVDNSFSMEAQGTKGSLLDEAKDKASEIASGYKQNDLFQLITNDFEGRHQQLVSRDEFITMLNEVEVSSQVRSLKEIIARQSDLLESSKPENEIVNYISDFQQSTVMKALPDKGFKNGFLIPLKPASKHNLFVDSCWFTNPILQLNEQATLNVKITNISDTKLEKIPVKLIIDDAQRSAASVDIEAGASQEISFSFSNNKAGIMSGYIEINDFPVTYDDDYYFTFKISPEIPVLCINNEKYDQYINSVFGVDSIIKLTNTTVRQIDFSSLNSFNLIILNSLNTFSTGLIQELKKYASNGGNILIVPSMQTTIESQNNLLSQFGTDLFTGVDSIPIKVAKVNTNHPIYKDVFEKEALKEENLNMPTVNMHMKVAPVTSSKTETLLELSNNEPFLNITSYSSGIIYLFTSSLTDAAGNFVRNALFVPTMLNIAFRSEKIKPLMYYIDDSRPIALSNSIPVGDNVIKLSESKGTYEFIPEIRESDGQTFIFTNNQVPRAGIFDVVFNGKKIDILAFNYNRKESDLTLATPDELNRLSSKTGYTLLENSPKPLNEVINESNLKKNMWKWFIVGALFSLLSETLLLALFKNRGVKV